MNTTEKYSQKNSDYFFQDKENMVGEQKLSRFNAIDLT